MRARIVEATLSTILEAGYADTTVVEIARRAGVTRGAVNHHYDSKDDVIVDAISHMLMQASEDIRSWASAVRSGTLTLSDFLDQTWGLFSGPFFMVTLEQITASRHNDDLKRRLVLVTKDFHNALDETWRCFFGAGDRATQHQETVLNATLCMFRGMGVQSVLRADPDYYRRLLDFWKKVLHENLEEYLVSP